MKLKNSLLLEFRPPNRIDCKSYLNMMKYFYFIVFELNVIRKFKYPRKSSIFTPTKNIQIEVLYFRNEVTNYLDI